MTLGSGASHELGAVESRAIGGPSPDLTKIMFQTCKRKGIFLTLFHEGIPGEQGGKGGRSQVGGGAQSRAGGFQRAPENSFSPLSPALLNFLKAPNSKRDSGVHYIELSPPFQAKINLMSLAAPRGKGRERKWEAKEKNSLDQFPLANTITRLPGSSASCWQACWPPASLSQLLAAPGLPPEWGGLAGVKAPRAPWLGLLNVASQGCCKSHWYLSAPLLPQNSLCSGSCPDEGAL